MRRVIASVLVLAVATLVSSRAESNRIQNLTLVPERRTTLQVGELAMLLIPSEHHYSIVASGDVLIPVRHTRRGGLYRAVRPGLETILLSPHVSRGECVSCATLHYFITVVSQG